MNHHSGRLLYLKTLQKHLNTLFIILRSSSVYLFRAALYKLIYVFYKVALFHCYTSTVDKRIVEEVSVDEMTRCQQIIKSRKMSKMMIDNYGRCFPSFTTNRQFLRSDFSVLPKCIRFRSCPWWFNECPSTN